MIHIHYSKANRHKQTISQSLYLLPISSRPPGDPCYSTPNRRSFFRWVLLAILPHSFGMGSPEGGTELLLLQITRQIRFCYTQIRGLLPGESATGISSEQAWIPRTSAGILHKPARIFRRNAQVILHKSARIFSIFGPYFCKDAGYYKQIRPELPADLPRCLQ